MSQNQCPNCLRAYAFSTDGNGRLVKLHPRKPCVPPVSNPQKQEIRCINCHGFFPRGMDAKTRTKKLCSRACKDEWAVVYRERNKERAKLLRLAKLQSRIAIDRRWKQQQSEKLL